MRAISVILKSLILYFKVLLTVYWFISEGAFGYLGLELDCGFQIRKLRPVLFILDVLKFEIFNYPKQKIQNIQKKKKNKLF